MAQATAPAVSPRADGRWPDQLRPIRFQNDIAPYATGSTLIEWGNTKVICGVTVEENVPRWMKEQNVAGGWITAEYSMLPYSTLQRKARDSTRGKIDGRSQEIGSIGREATCPSPRDSDLRTWTTASTATGTTETVGIMRWWYWTGITCPCRRRVIRRLSTHLSVVTEPVYDMRFSQTGVSRRT